MLYDLPYTVLVLLQDHCFCLLKCHFDFLKQAEKVSGGINNKDVEDSGLVNECETHGKIFKCLEGF